MLKGLEILFHYIVACFDQFIRRNSTSGGMGTWIALSMLNSGLIDRITCSTYTLRTSVF